MTYGIRLFQRLGFFARKTDLPDAFASRLSRIGMREGQLSGRAGLFRN